MADAKCTSSTQVSVPQQKYSDDGEPILAEGFCCRSGVHAEVCFCNILLFALSFVLIVPIIIFPYLCFIAIYCGRRAALSWRLYLTPSGIHHTKVAMSPCCYKKIFIPLTDITHVNGCDADNTITIAYRGYKILVVRFVDNASMFTEAVKQQLSART